MRAITFQGLRSVGVTSVPDPRIEAPGDAIVRVSRSAICGSDLHVYHGRERGLEVGTVMGHELVGEVVEKGTQVQLRTGAIVASPFTTSCGSCFYCREGLTARCTQGQLLGWVQDGYGLHGAQSEYVRVPLADTTLLEVPADVTLEEALLLGDVLGTGFYCAERGGVAVGLSVAVVGAGPVGLMAIVAARELGASMLWAIDALPERLRLAQRFGALPLALADLPQQTIARATDGRGADVVLEAVGSREAGRLAFELVRPGGTISSAGVHTQAQFAFSPIEAYDKNLSWRGGRSPARAYMERLLPLLRSRKYDLTAIVSHRLPLAEGVRAYDIFDRKLEGCTKVVLTP